MPRPERIISKFTLVVLGCCTALLLFTLIWLGFYAQPIKDDYLSAVMFKHQSVQASLGLQYRQFNGRLVSAFLMRFSPLQYHSFLGYKLACIGFILVFAGAFFITINRQFATHFHTTDRLGLFFLGFISFNCALGNFAEFYYWLPAITCYGTACLLTLLLLRVLPAVVDCEQPRQNWKVFLAIVVCLLLPLTCEPGTIMVLGVLAVFGLKFHSSKTLRRGMLALLIGCLLSSAIVNLLSPGNALRFATSPYERNIFKIIAGSLYAFSGLSIRLLFYFFAPVLVGYLMWLSAKNGSVTLNRSLLKRLVGSVVALLFLGEVVCFIGLGGMPALRVQNSFLFMGVCLLPICLALSMKRNLDTPAIIPAFRRPLIQMLVLWTCLPLFLAQSAIVKSLQELLAGVPQQYDLEMKAVYLKAAAHDGGKMLAVGRVHQIPSALFIAQPLVMAKDTANWNYWNRQMADYFHRTALYTDSLAVVSEPSEEFHDWIVGFISRK